MAVGVGSRAGRAGRDRAASGCTIVSLQGFYVAVLGLMALFVLARSLAGWLDGSRRSSFDNTLLLWHFAMVQGAIGLILVALFPRALGS